MNRLQMTISCPSRWGPREACCELCVCACACNTAYSRFAVSLWADAGSVNPVLIETYSAVIPNCFPHKALSCLTDESFTFCDFLLWSYSTKWPFQPLWLLELSEALQPLQLSQSSGQLWPWQPSLSWWQFVTSPSSTTLSVKFCQN